MYNDLDNVSESLGLFEDAITWHRKAWDIRALSYNATSENIAHCQVNMARSILCLGREEEAFAIVMEAEAVFSQAEAWYHQAQ